MIELYTFPTPNGRKVSIALEELGLPYTAHPVDITKGEQMKPSFLMISPNNKIPAIVDRENSTHLMESAAILLYLADKCGQLMPAGAKRWVAMEWIMWQMGGLGPILGQTHHFVKYNQGKSAYAETRFSDETRRLYGVLNQRLEDHEYIADEYSMADIACWPWISRFEWQEMDLNEYPNLRRWYLDIAGREAVVRGYAVPFHVNDIPMPA